MSSITIPGADLAASAKFNTFATGVTANAAALGLTVGQVESANDAADDFAAKLLAANNAKDAAKGAVSEKDKSRKTTTSSVRELAQIVKNAPGATPAAAILSWARVSARSVMSAPFVSSRVVHSLDGPEGVGDGTLMIAKLFRVVVAARPQPSSIQVTWR